MRPVLLLIMALLFSGCSMQTLHTKTMQTLREVSKHIPIIESPHDRSSSTLYFEVVDQNSWKIMQPPEGQWRGEHGTKVDGPGLQNMSYLPDYFPSRPYYETGGMGYNNFFYTLYRLDNGEELAMWIINQRAPVLRKHTWTDLWSNTLARVDDITNMTICEKDSNQEIIMMINKSDVYFDSSKVNIIIGNKLINNIEIIHKSEKIYKSNISDNNINVIIGSDQNYYYTYKTIDHNIYNLLYTEDIDKEKHIMTGYDMLSNDHKTLNKDPLYRYSSGSYKYSSFPYIFNATCQDLEDAVLVVDGLTYHGEPLPPLKVRMKYYDYSIIPEYTGSVQKGLEANIEGQPDATP